MGTVLLREESLDKFAFFRVVDLQRVVGAGGEEQFAGIVEVKRGHQDVGLRKLE